MRGRAGYVYINIYTLTSDVLNLPSSVYRPGKYAVIEKYFTGTSKFTVADYTKPLFKIGVSVCVKRYTM